MSLTPQFLDELRARTLLSSLVGKTVKLQKAGREFRACCPFHNEKTPSFYVNDDKGFYHCFGCSAHGDAIRWLTDQRGLPFMDAVKELAQAAGMEMPAQDRQSVEKAQLAKGLHEAMADAAAWFTERLSGIEGAEARAVLERRGIKPETARAFRLGFSPDSRGKLKEALKGFGDPILIEAGLLISVENKEPYDRFRGRLMIPIHDARGRTIAFGGRVIGDGEPKYLNSPDTPLFDKGRTLYNLDRAAAAARKAGRIIAVEGYMDVIALTQAGFEETVAPLGTALTEHQIQHLWRMSDAPLLCFDGDSAGQKAARRAARRALPMLKPSHSLAFVTLPQGLDPDDFIRERGRAAFETLLRFAQPLNHILYSEARHGAEIATPEGRAGLNAQLALLSESIENRSVRKEYERTFQDLYEEEFGWSRKDRKKIKEAALATGLLRNINLARTYTRSTLYGLSRFPVALLMTLELVSSINVGQDDLKRWQETLVERAIKQPPLETDAIRSIIQTDGQLDARARQELRTDLRFPWDIRPGLAEDRLTGLVRLLAEHQEIEAELAELNAKIVADESLASYDPLEARRRILRAEREALKERGYFLGLPVEQDDDAA